MDGKELAQITETRFAAWSKVLSAHHAIPTIVVGIGHNEHEGELYVFTPSAATHEHTAVLLAHALQTLTALIAGQRTQGHDGIQSHTNGCSEPGD